MARNENDDAPDPDQRQAGQMPPRSKGQSWMQSRSVTPPTPPAKPARLSPPPTQPAGPAEMKPHTAGQPQRRPRPTVEPNATPSVASQPQRRPRTAVEPIAAPPVAGPQEMRARQPGQPRRAAKTALPVTGNDDLARFWDAVSIDAGFLSADPGDVTLPPARVAVRGQDLSVLLTPACRVLAKSGAALPAPRIGQPTPILPPAPKSAPAAGPGVPQHAELAASAGRLPKASFRTMDWQALGTYCRQHLPDASDDAGRRRLATAMKDKRTLDVARQLAGELRRWLKVLNLDLLQASGPAKTTTRTHVTEGRGWVQVLDGVIPTSD